MSSIIIIAKPPPQAASVSTSDAQQALNQLTDTLTQQADANGTVSGLILRQDLQQLFQNLKGQNKYDDSECGVIHQTPYLASPFMRGTTVM